MNKVRIEDLPFEQYGVTKVISICDWIKAAYGNEEPNFEQCTKDFKIWMKSNPVVHYYARSREHFFISEGAHEAQRFKKGFVLVEDLS